MHAYIIVGNDERQIEKAILNITKKFKTQPLEFKVEKISDIRELNSFIQLKINKPQFIIIRNIDKASSEALNAFLKNLEEPQENIYFILTSKSIFNLPGTIISRCLVVYSQMNYQNHNLQQYKNFMEKSLREKLDHISAIKKRPDAVDFISNIINTSHHKLYQKNSDFSSLVKNLKIGNQTYKALNLNGNVNLHLTNFVLHLF